MVDYSGPAHADLLQREVRQRLPRVVETDHVQLELKDEVSQAVMRPVAADGYDYTYVIMPMRL